MTKAEQIFEKLALQIKELNTLDDLYHADKDVYKNTVERMQINPQANVGRYLNSGNKRYIFIDHRIDPKSKAARKIRRHELTHYIRDKKGLRTAKWSHIGEGSGLTRLKMGIGNFVEEFAAGRTMFQRGLKSNKLNEISFKYIYPTEVGLGAALGKNVKFTTLRKLLKALK